MPSQFEIAVAVVIAFALVFLAGLVAWICGDSGDDDWPDEPRGGAA